VKRSIGEQFPITLPPDLQFHRLPEQNSIGMLAVTLKFGLTPSRGERMRKNIMAGLLFVLALGLLSLTGCEDTKARQENEQLKAHVAELVKESGDLGNRVDALTQENAALKQENEQLKRKANTKKTKKSKHHRSTPNGQ
jgi:outer membrane murein-binding lipoprotein Lpp